VALTAVATKDVVGVPVQGFDCAPGETIAITGSGFGATAGTLVLRAQGGAGATYLTLPAASWADGEIDVVIPDGLVSDALLIYKNGNPPTVPPAAPNQADFSVALRVGSKYVQPAEFIGQGIDVSRLQPGELDAVLRQASDYVDLWLGHTLRLIQTVERHPWRKSRRVYPFKFPIASVDGFTIRISNTQTAVVQPADVVLNNTQGYIEVLSLAVAAYSFSQAIMNFGLTANIVELTYTAGFAMTQYPSQLRTATIIVATELLIYRSIQARGLGGLASVKQGNQQYDRRSEPFQIPQPAKELLLAFRPRGLH